MSYASVFTFDYESFISLFPEFNNPVTFPELRLQGNWDQATCYCSNINFGRLNNSSRLLALQYVTAHITQYFYNTTKGKRSLPITQSTVDKIAVSLLAPPVSNSWQFFMSSTPYGQAYLALLQSASAGGFVVNGVPNGLAIRGFNGNYS
jgi:hypothetical protein